VSLVFCLGLFNPVHYVYVILVVVQNVMEDVLVCFSHWWGYGSILLSGFVIKRILEWHEGENCDSSNDFLVNCYLNILDIKTCQNSDLK
jgi:hypothetical protein